MIFSLGIDLVLFHLRFEMLLLHVINPKMKVLVSLNILKPKGMGNACTLHACSQAGLKSACLSVSCDAQELEDSLACPYTAQEAVLALNKIYLTMHEKAPQGGKFLKRWGNVLLRPELSHAELACEILENAILESEEPLPPPKEIVGEHT
jgi:hypothetical protein